MIEGRVNNHEAIVVLELALSTGAQFLKVEATIDTGYNGHLTLPIETVSLLQLPFAGHRRGMLADGSIAILELYIAQVKWHDTLQEVGLADLLVHPVGSVRFCYSWWTSRKVFGVLA